LNCIKKDIIKGDLVVGREREERGRERRRRGGKGVTDGEGGKGNMTRGCDGEERKRKIRRERRIVLNIDGCDC
jgi:hypothetical protein